MKSDLLAKSPLLALPLLAFVLFVAVFLVMFVMTMRKRPETVDRFARMPLDDRDPEGAPELDVDGDRR